MFQKWLFVLLFYENVSQADMYHVTLCLQGILLRIIGALELSKKLVNHIIQVKLERNESCTVGGGGTARQLSLPKLAGTVDGSKLWINIRKWVQCTVYWYVQCTLVQHPLCQGQAGSKLITERTRGNGVCQPRG